MTDEELKLVESRKDTVFIEYCNEEDVARRKDLLSEWEHLNHIVDEAREVPETGPSKLETISHIVSIVCTVAGAVAGIATGVAEVNIKREAINANVAMFNSSMEYERTGTFTTAESKAHCVTKPIPVKI